MTAPISMGIRGFPPGNLLTLGAVPTLVAYVTAGANSYTVPIGVTRIMAELWGGGEGVAAPAGAGDVDSGNSGGYALVSFPVLTGQIITSTVGAGGASTGAAGGDTTVALDGVTVGLAAGGTSATVQVGDITIVQSVGEALDTLEAFATFLPTAPRGGGTSRPVSGVSQTGVWPGGGGYGVNGGGGGAGAAGGVLLYVPNPVTFQ